MEEGMRTTALAVKDSYLKEPTVKWKKEKVHFLVVIGIKKKGQIKRN